MVEHILRRLVIYDKVNSCETSAELQQCILALADEDGMIQGRTRKFSAEKMAEGVDYFLQGEVSPNVLTREFGIRQQALYIKYYTPVTPPLNIEVRLYDIGKKPKK